MAPDDLYTLVLRIERDKVFRERLQRDAKGTLAYDRIGVSSHDMDVLHSVDWSQGLSELEIELNRRLQEGSPTAWGDTAQSVAGEWGSVADIELLPDKTDGDLRTWAAGTIASLNAHKADYGFERLYICQSLRQPERYSLIGAWELQQSALDFPSLLEEQFAIGDVAQIVNPRPAFQVICRVAEQIAGEGMASSYGVIETWQLLPGADGQKFRDNRFSRFSAEQALKQGFVGSVVGWSLDNPEQFQVVAGYATAEDAAACTGHPTVVPFDGPDGAQGVGVYAERVNDGDWDYIIAPWAAEAPPALGLIPPAH